MTDWLKNHIKTWPWAQTVIATTLFLAAFYVVAPFVVMYLDKKLPSDMLLDHARNLITVMFTSGVVLVIGRRATYKREAAEFDAQQGEGP